MEVLGRVGLKQRGSPASGVTANLGHQGNCFVGASSNQEKHAWTVSVMPPPVLKDNACMITL